MSEKNDDILTGPVPAPDAEATPSERTHAKTFADLVDKSLSGARMPPAMSADDRALIEVATVIRAGHGSAELSAEKRRSIVEDALRQAVGGGATQPSDVTPITKARKKRLPWIVAAASTLVAAAAILLIWLRRPDTAPDPVPETAQVPTEWTSRSADPLIGRIPRARAGDAATRIDTIFADRLEGYRGRTLAARGRTP